MRNLKKILALVLALVMSLSLMSVAGATEFPDSDQISETYAESVDVLTGLKVFQGNKGEFKPKDNITRAEVANIIYRIVTGDVDGASVGIYADYNKFTDVPNTAWFAGCVNYCANAEYIKGRGNGKFDPYGNVTGYEALAMILRAIGYDKNGEFTGANWQIQTAATARNRGITKNIVEGTLGVAASREMVAEILCQTILVPVADYSLAFGYRTTDAVTGKENETLAKKTFKMEKLTGVVTANEYADLDDTAPLGADQTKIGGKTLNVHSTLDDLGESRYVYVIPQSGTTRYDLVSSKVYDTGDNNVYDSGAAVKTVDGSTGKDNGITSITGAKHLRNYGELTDNVSDWRIEYVIRKTWTEYEALTVLSENGTALLKEDTNNDGTYDATITVTGTESTWNRTTQRNYEYRKAIQPNTKITATDFTLIKEIFNKSSHINGVNTTISEIGEVYVGTSTIVGTDDVSNKMSYAQFADTYLHDKDNTIGSNGQGNRLKIIDNDNNGIAEYVLQTVYTVAIVSNVASDGKISLDVMNAEFDKLADGCHNVGGHEIAPDGHSVDNVNQILSTTKTAVYGDGEVATGDVVLYALIDGKALMEKADGETAKIDKVVRTDRTVTTVDGNEYKESAVHEHSSSLSHTVANLVGNTTYSLYFDKYGNLAAFTEGANGEFTLITEGWYDNRKAGAEYAVRAYIDGSLQTVDVTTGGSLFISNNTLGQNNSWSMLKKFAGLNDDGDTNGTDDIHTTVAVLNDGLLNPVDKVYRYNKQHAMIEMQYNVIPGRDNQTTSKGWVHNTNYVFNGDAYNDVYGLVNGGIVDIVDNAKTDANRVDVRALSTTTYYYVYNLKSANNNTISTVVREYTGYASLPTIRNAYIEDVYAVGTAATNASGVAYYTADVVVVELTDEYHGVTSAEQVFIPEFATVQGNIQTELVKMIRGNGDMEEVLVDLSNSDLRYYDPASGTWTNSTAPGLFFMDESDTVQGTYVLRRMTRQDIQNSDKYAVGYVSMYDAPNGANWTNFDRYVFNGTDTPKAYSVADHGDQIARITNGVGKYYMLSYNAAGNANLREEPQSTVLAQNPDMNIRNDVTNSWANETNLGTNVQRNEVLVAYSGSNVAYVVSFNEYLNTTTRERDFAQSVWADVMPLDYGTSITTAPSVTFYDVPDTNTGDDLNPNENAITVTWGVANANTKQIVVTPGKDNTISNVQVYSALDGANAPITGIGTPTKHPDPNNGSWSIALPAAAVANGATYLIDVTYPDGSTVKNIRYTLVQQPQVTAWGNIYSTNRAKVGVANQNNTNETIDLTVYNSNEIKLSDLANTYLKADGYAVKVSGVDGSGNVMADNAYVDHAVEITVTLVNKDGAEKSWAAKKSVASPNGNLNNPTTDNPTTYYTLELHNVKAYSDSACTTELEGNTVASGTTVYFAATGTGVIQAIQTTAGAGQGSVVALGANTVAGKTSGSVSVTKDLKVTFYPAEDRDLDWLTLNPTMAAKYGVTADVPRAGIIDLYITDVKAFTEAIYTDGSVGNDQNPGPIALNGLKDWFDVEIRNDADGMNTGVYQGVERGEMGAYWSTSGGGQPKLTISVSGVDGGDGDSVQVYFNLVGDYTAQFSTVNATTQNLVIKNWNDNSDTKSVTSVTVYKSNDGTNVGGTKIADVTVTGWTLSGGTYTGNCGLTLAAGGTIYAVVVINGKTVTTEPIYVQGT